MNLFLWSTQPECWFMRSYLVLSSNKEDARSIAISRAIASGYNKDVDRIRDNKPYIYGENVCLIFEEED
jgi:hypothetical protein